jgi:DNA-binding response OmpR family regulator
MSGFDVCRQLTSQPNSPPVIMLTARSQEGEKILGFQAGVDDYVTKPFSVMELLARVQAVLRRTRARSAVGTHRIGSIEIDFRRHRAHRDGLPIDFTSRELDLLRFFVVHSGEIVTREQILKEVWGYSSEITTRTIDYFVVQLRQKIEVVPGSPRHILTVHGTGYKFVD